MSFMCSDCNGDHYPDCGDKVDPVFLTGFYCNLKSRKLLRNTQCTMETGQNITLGYTPAMKRDCEAVCILSLNIFNDFDLLNLKENNNIVLNKLEHNEVRDTITSWLYIGLLTSFIVYCVFAALSIDAPGRHDIAGFSEVCCLAGLVAFGLMTKLLYQNRPLERAQYFIGFGAIAILLAGVIPSALRIYPKLMHFTMNQWLSFVCYPAIAFVLMISVIRYFVRWVVPKA